MIYQNKKPMKDSEILSWDNFKITPVNFNATPQFKNSDKNVTIVKES